MSLNAGKEQNSQANDAKESSSSNQSGKMPGDKAKTEPMVICCKFLELPAEIRNRIYHFAEEEVYDDCDDYDDYDDLGPPLLVRNTKAAADSATVPHVRSTLRYRALTQVCNQIRTEYRPIWLRQCRFRMQLPTVAHFINAYYPKVTNYQNAPKLLLISWDHGHNSSESDVYYGDDEESMEDVLTDITLLARLRANCPTFTVNFASRQVLEDDVPNIECFECEHSIYCGCDIDCDHEETWDEVHWHMRWSYGYLDALNVFLANTNENWLKMLRGPAILRPRVEFTFHVPNQTITIYIRFSKGQAPRGFKLKSMYNSALGFLNHWGMLDLKASESIDYVIGEATGKSTRHAGGCDSYVSTYNQIHLDSSTITVWKKEKDAKASAP